MVRPTRNILVAVTGQTPAVITETLWALGQQKGLRVDEFRVINTVSGKRAILEKIFGPGRAFFPLEVCLRCGLIRVGEFSTVLSKQQSEVYVIFLPEFNSPRNTAQLSDLLERLEKLAD